MNPRVLECSRCGGPVGYRAPFCAYCRSPLAWSTPPSVERGAHFFSCDYRHHPIASRDVAVERSAEGAVVTVSAPFVHLEDACPVRDAVSAVEAVALDRGAGFGVVARAYSDGGVVTGYVAGIVPSFRCFRLIRVVEGAGVSTARVLSEWQECHAVRPPGEPNVVEIRAADSVLQVHVNGEHVLGMVDAGLAFGASGFRLVALEGHSRVLVRRLDAYEAFAVR